MFFFEILFFFFAPTGSSAPNHRVYHAQTRSNKRLFRVCSFEPTSFRISTSVFSLYSIPKNFKISQQPSGSLTPIQTLNTLSSRVPRPSSTRGPGVGHARGPGGQVIRAILRAGGGRTAKVLRQHPPFQALCQLWTLVFGGFAFLPFSLGPAGDCPCRH